jgi:hypothetical protein
VAGEVVGKEVHFDLAVRPGYVAEGVDQKEILIRNIDREFLYICRGAAIDPCVRTGKINPIGFEAIVADSE